MCGALLRRRLHPPAACSGAFATGRRSNSFSLIHEARPQALEEEHYTQALFAAAVALLGSTPDGVQPPGVNSTDAGVLYALLLLFRTQHCTPRVHVYMPPGAWQRRTLAPRGAG